MLHTADTALLFDLHRITTYVNVNMPAPPPIHLPHTLTPPSTHTHSTSLHALTTPTSILHTLHNPVDSLPQQEERGAGILGEYSRCHKHATTQLNATAMECIVNTHITATQEAIKKETIVSQLLRGHLTNHSQTWLELL